MVMITATTAGSCWSYCCWQWLIRQQPSSQTAMLCWCVTMENSAAQPTV